MQQLDQDAGTVRAMGRAPHIGLCTIVTAVTSSHSPRAAHAAMSASLSARSRAPWLNAVRAASTRCKRTGLSSRGSKGTKGNAGAVQQKQQNQWVRRMEYLTYCMLISCPIAALHCQLLPQPPPPTAILACMRLDIVRLPPRSGHAAPCPMDSE